MRGRTDGGRKEGGTHAVRGIDAVYAELAHGYEQVVCGLEKVSVYRGTERHELFARVSILVDNLHLLDYR